MEAIITWISEKILGEWAAVVIPVVLLALNMGKSDRERLVAWVKDLITLPKVLLWDNPKAYIKAARSNVEDPNTVTLGGFSDAEVRGLVDVVVVDGVRRILYLAVDLFYALLPFYFTFMKARAKKKGA